MHDSNNMSQQIKITEGLKSADMFDVVVHIGAPKTGSSALQYFLMSNSSLLENYGFFYPVHGVDSNGISCGHSGLGIHFINGDLNQAKQVFDGYIKQAKEKNLRLLLSSESFYPFAKNFKSISGDYKVRVIGFIRDPLQAIISSYNQLVKRHFYAETLYTYCQKILNRSATEFLGEELVRWEKEFGSGNVSFYHYDNVNANESTNKIETFFLPVLGIPNEEHINFAFPEKLINRSYTKSALELKRLLNNVLDKSNNVMNDAIDICLQSYSDNHPAPKLEFDAILDSEMIVRLKKKFELGNSSLKVKRILSANNTIEQERTSENSRSVIQDESLFDSLVFVAENAFRSTPELIAYIKNCLCNRLMPGNTNQNIITLVNIFGLQGCVIEAADESNFFTKAQLGILVANNSAKFDILYQIAVSFERCRDYPNAYWIISELLKLRPTGPVLLETSERLEKFLKIKQVKS
jgi:hypothetical protein